MQTYDQRAKFVSAKKKLVWQQLSPARMTEESDGDEGQVVITHKLAWCSEGMNMYYVFMYMYACMYVCVYIIQLSPI